MKVALHLVSTLWARPRCVSSQTGALKAYLQNALPEVKPQTHSAHLWIYHKMGSDEENKQLFRDFDCFEEYPFGLIYLRDFGMKDLKRSGQTFNQILKKTNATKPNERPMTVSRLEKLRKATHEYVRECLVPALSKDRLNVIGFTMNGNQVFSSAHMARLIQQEAKGIPLLFLFGGSSAALPEVKDRFQKLGLNGVFVLGEGERKAESICRALIELPNEASEDQMIEAATHAASGVFSTYQDKDMWNIDREELSSQVGDLAELPLPDYSEYYQTMRLLSADEEEFKKSASETVIFLEGSRGCFAKCSFCSHHYLLYGYRKMAADTVVDRFNKAAVRYPCGYVHFVDNVCDSWAEKFSEKLMAQGNQLDTFIRLRAHHPEQYWTKLWLGGIQTVMIGMEALAPHVLKLIGKGTSVIQNLRAHKWINELGFTTSCNLITFYPESTPEDVLETKRIILATAHLQDFFLSRFQLVHGSPLYNKIPPEDRSKLKLDLSACFPKALEKYELCWGYKFPNDWLSRESKKAWEDFTVWYEALKKRMSAQKPSFTAQRLPGGRIRVKEQGLLETRELIYENQKARVLDECHAGLAFEYLLKKLSGVTKDELNEILNELITDGVILFADNHYLTLPLRPARELISRCYRSKPDIDHRQDAGATA